MIYVAWFACKCKLHNVEAQILTYKLHKDSNRLISYFGLKINLYD